MPLQGRKEASNQAREEASKQARKKADLTQTNIPRQQSLSCPARAPANRANDRVSYEIRPPFDRSGTAGTGAVVWPETQRTTCPDT